MAERVLEFAPNVVFREEPGGAILFDVDTGDVRVVEGVAWGICALIEPGTTRKSILEELLRRYPGEESIEADLDAFLSDLDEAGLLRGPAS
ncbi:PqqD family protein [Candidatus Fermentibacterales bacterium]|nr:PqqD family protein [Candidatus Fermentibacterales bacterium]